MKTLRAPRRRNDEHKIQCAIVAFIRAQYAVIIAACPNGGRRGRLEAIRLSQEGVLAGHPDLVIYAPGPRCFWMEVKTPIGRVSPEQKAFIGDLTEMGFIGAVVRSLDDAIARCAEWRLPKRADAKRRVVETGF